MYEDETRLLGIEFQSESVHLKFATVHAISNSVNVKEIALRINRINYNITSS